jgi:hypothetical protein
MPALGRYEISDKVIFRLPEIGDKTVPAQFSAQVGQSSRSCSAAIPRHTLVHFH